MDHKSLLKQTYNQFAAQREQTKVVSWKLQERQAFLDQLKERSLINLLEVGAGTGKDGLFFQENGLNVTCVDLSDEMVKHCQSKGLPAHVMDFSQLSFADETFDAVYAMNCLLHVPKQELASVLLEIRRVLQSGGLFFCGVYGGQDSEGVWDGDHYEPKRFFAMYHDEDLVEIVGRYFEIVDFHTVSVGDNTPHFQSLLVAKR